MNTAEFQQYVKEWSALQGFDQSSMEQRMLFLMTEVGELAKEVLSVSYHPDAERKANLGHEMYDVVWNIFDLANMLGIDLEQAFKEKMQINNTRTWA
ncbi:MazG nucleotide pyrophosphohydrolase domain-containing protein [Paenibacillus sp. CF384]|uniref:MazG nucleotide pyrophosphohydrolase domain-containing protein n=1 Tax=Paenibacillus sp. CF384 TaxID=1884382 RepID=UPI000898A22D|nr:MazG nucleotide pyrophosphohydrolase domain-containing protein [Paenibacillus sp. CF384]SDX66743.1 NTP pyrophosphatase, house-cleaning of non-canonical NTPs [Paenibacillus sp. CF384]